MSNRDTPINNTPYSDEELQYFKKLLQGEHEETRQDIKNLKESVDNIMSIQGDENSAAAHHQGDIASEEDEREKYLKMIEKQQDKLEEINAALDRIASSTYGVCEATGAKIKKERLEAIPYARLSMEAQKKNEA